MLCLLAVMLLRSGSNLVQEIDPPPSLYKGHPADPTPGVPPTCPSRFHRTPIHTILDERLGIFEVFPDTKLRILWG